MSAPPGPRHTATATFPIIAGIILTALGLEGVLAHADAAGALGAFYRLPLYGAAAIYLAGQLLFKNRLHGGISRTRLTAVVALLAVAPIAALIPPLGALAGLVVAMTLLVVIETIRYRPVRQSLAED
jgi:low temperature requirement protein LtrA